MGSKNIIVESVKPCEDEEKAFIIRVYEAEGTRTNGKIEFSDEIKAYAETDMLEKEISRKKDEKFFASSFRPFEIKTLNPIIKKNSRVLPAVLFLLITGYFKLYIIR